MITRTARSNWHNSSATRVLGLFRRVTTLTRHNGTDNCLAGDFNVYTTVCAGGMDLEASESRCAEYD